MQGDASVVTPAAQAKLSLDGRDALQARDDTLSALDVTSYDDLMYLQAYLDLHRRMAQAESQVQYSDNWSGAMLIGGGL